MPALLFAMYAQTKVNSTFNKYRTVGNRRGFTGADVARKILDMNGLRNVTVERVAGNLTDHYDPRTNVVRLSDATYSSTSVAAIGVAAHEVGHAIQHAEGYAPIKVRNTIVPVVQIASYAAWPLAIIGLIMSFEKLAIAGIVMFISVYVTQFYLSATIVNTAILISEGIIIYLLVIILLKEDFLKKFLNKNSDVI